MSKSPTPHHSAVRLGKKGRITIPAAYRRALGLLDGDTIVVELGESELRLLPSSSRVVRAQRLVRRYVPAGTKLVDSLIRDRRRAASRE
jgi:AbrB family looped-hinge helix DNA binding protein